jgi:hypothetical protein
LENVLLFRRKLVLLAAFLQLKTVGQKIESSSNLPVDTIPRIVISRIAEIPVYRERLLYT